MLFVQLQGDQSWNFYTANKKFLEFERVIMVPPDLKNVYDFLQKALTDVRKNSGWQSATSL
jgi:hypothetical protein